MKKNTLGIYIHIPFCVRKCAYCDFLSAPPQSEEQVHGYVNSLCTEIAVKSDKYLTDIYGVRMVDTIFFGGGTPSLLDVKDFNRIMQALRESFIFSEDVEITVECNPDTVDFDKLCNYKEQGVNRISFGLQSACNEELMMLGRIHSYERFVEAYEDARRAGFENINVDLISAIPGQTLNDWEQTLLKVAKLGAEHISAYSLIVEEGTRFFDDRESYKFPTEDEDVAMYEATERILKSFGYYRYEISNYAKKGHESRHNNRYWQRKDYLGMGVGASSCIADRRFSNVTELSEYESDLLDGKEPTDEENILLKEECMAEFFYLGLRRMEGVFFSDFEKEFETDVYELYGTVIENLVRSGLIEYIYDNERDFQEISESIYKREPAEISVIGIRLSAKGIFLSNRVFLEFV